MFEAIAANHRRSLVLVTLLGLVLVVLGGVIGWAIASGFSDAGSRHARMTSESDFATQLLAARDGIYWGVAIALAIWLVLWLTAVAGGEQILLGSAHAHEITKDDAPQLWNVVEEMTIAAGLGQMPRVFLIDDPGLNAFAVGQSAGRAAVVVTAGLLKRLDRDELQGVIAHELGHIRNLDARFLTRAGVMVGAVVLISELFLRGMFYSGGRRSSSRGGGQAQAILMVVAVLVAILAPLAAQVLYFACSRRREYLADACSARFTRYPPGLANALEKISQQPALKQSVSRVHAPLYIINPLRGAAGFSLFATHPPTDDRIRILREMGGAGFAAYETAFRQTHGGRQSCLGPRTLAAADEAAVRATAAPVRTQADAVAQATQVTGLLDRIANLVVIPCACGVKLKLPPDFKRPTVTCPHCGWTHQTQPPKATDASPAAVQHEHRRRGRGWEVFACPACGHNVQLSPRFSASSTNCPHCSVRIAIDPPPG